MKKRARAASQMSNLQRQQAAYVHIESSQKRQQAKQAAALQKMSNSTSRFRGNDENELDRSLKFTASR